MDQPKVDVSTEIDEECTPAKCQRCLEHVITVNVVGNIFLVLLKGYLGILGGSKALFADAIHSLGDLLASFMMYIALKVADRPKCEEYAYGRGKAEYTAAVIIAGFLLVLGVYIFVDGAKDLISGRAIAPHLMAGWGALVSVIVNEIMCRQGQCVDARFNKPSVSAVALESRVDTYSSIAVLAGIIGSVISLPIIDSIVAILVALIILHSSAEMFFNATKKLLDVSMPDEILKKIRTAVLETPKILGIGDLRTREMGSKSEVDITILVDKTMVVGQFDSIKTEVEKAIKAQVPFECHIIVRLKPHIGTK